MDVEEVRDAMCGRRGTRRKGGDAKQTTTTAKVSKDAGGAESGRRKTMSLGTGLEMLGSSGGGGAVARIGRGAMRTFQSLRSFRVSPVGGGRKVPTQPSVVVEGN